MSFLEVKNISKKFGNKDVFTNISFKIDKGEILGILGYNGTGKTVLLKILAGLYQYDHGNIYIDNIPFYPTSPAESIRFGIGYIPQFSYLDIKFTIRELEKLVNLKISSFFKLFNLELNIDKKLIFFDEIHLQIIECCIAFARNSDIIIFDEPIFINESSYDYYWIKIKEYCKCHSIAIIFISHNINTTITHSEKLLILDEKTSASIDNCSDKSEMLERAKKHFNIHTFFEEKHTQIDNTFIQVSFKNVVTKFYDCLNEKGTFLFYFDRNTITKFLKNFFSDNIYNKRFNKLNLSVLPGHYIDRGLSLNCSVIDNLSIPYYKVRNIKGSLKIISISKRETAILDNLEKFGVKPLALNELVKNFSGGNKQKLAYIKLILMSTANNLMIDPFRGLDINAIAFFKRYINDDLNMEHTQIIFTSSRFDTKDLNIKKKYSVILNP